MFLPTICKLKNQRTTAQSSRKALLTIFLLAFSSLLFAHLQLAPDRPDASYESGETANVVLTSSTSGTIAVSDNVPAAIPYTHSESGLVLCKVTMGSNNTIAAAAFDINNIQPLGIEPADFDAFLNTVSINCPANLNIMLPPNASSVAVSWNLPTTSSTCSTSTANINCGTVPSGFTLIGAHNQHEYLISNNIATWPTAEAACNSYSAHLVTLDNQLENDFLDANISTAVLIGINDATTETTYEWSSGTTVGYTNFQSPDVNTPEKDYGLFQFWNGKWDMISPFVFKNYVMELNCEPANTVQLTQIAGPTSGSILTAGTYTVTYRAEDNCGDVEICSFMVIVSENTQTITIDCPESITVYETPGANGAVVTFDDATATSTCANNAITINRITGLPSGSVFPVGVTLITFEATDSCAVNTCSFLVNVLATPPALAPIPFPEFMGANTRIQYPNERLSAAVGTVRDYYPWVLSEGFPAYESFGGPASPGYPFNKYKFNPAYQGQDYKHLDVHYNEIGGQNLILNTSMLQATPQIVAPLLLPSSPVAEAVLEQQPIYPAGSSSTNPASYIAHADWIYHFTARYGNNTFTTNRRNSIIAPKLEANETALTGLGHLQYIENWNEPDKWWLQASFPATHFTGYEYAAMTSADYDGHMQTMSLINDPDNPGQQISTVGAKNADPSIKFVLAGLANLNLNYIDSMRVWFEANRNANAIFGLYPFDVLNFHHYSYRSLPNNGGVGVSPEEDYLRNRLTTVVNYRNQYFPGKEVWLSEFGYDTDNSSTKRVPTEGIGNFDQREVQGQWIVRSFLEIAAAGVDRAHIFEFRDGCTGLDCGTFFSSGLLESAANDYKPKKSWYYVATLKHVMQGMEFDADISPTCSTSDTICTTNCARVYRFVDPDNPSERVYAVWSPTSCGNTPFNYTLNLEGATAATLHELEALSTIGKRTLVNGSSVNIAVSESPVFIKVGTATPPTTVSCPNNLTIGLQTCSTIRLNWAPTPGVSTLQLWYQEGHLASIADFDINSAVLAVDNYAVGIGNYLKTGLAPNTNYSFIVISVDAAGNISEPCLLWTNTTTNTCMAPIDPAWIYDSNNPANPPIELFDEQANFDPFCGNVGAPATPWGVTFNNDGPEFVSVDLQEEVILNAIALYDGVAIGMLQIDYSLSPNGPWTELLQYQTNSFAKWVYLDNLLPPTTPIRYLRITGSLNNDAIINEMFICVEPMDVDGDGYTVAEGDCNDENASIHPGATEICDDLDNDCDESVDEGLVFLNYYPDPDGDGYGANNTDPLSACNPPTNMVTNNLDCNDANAAINPAATESCDGIDNDCDGNIDDGVVFLNYYPDSDGDGYGDNAAAPVSACSPPANSVTNNLDCNDANAAINPAATESCDGIDNDCDGNIDDGVVFLNYYPDSDGDGYGDNAAAPVSACSPPANTVTNNLDCNDANAAINPAATESCDGIDNDCDGNIDDGVVFLNYYPDSDGDGYGDNAAAPISACSPPANTVTNNLDCNDANAAINPAATESCDGVDNDCDGNIDDGVVFLNYYPDADGDGYGANVAPISACSPPANTVTNNLDCNDANAAINPAATEICDGVDNDCDGNIDDGVVFLNYYPDSDGDGYGANNVPPVSACSPPANTVTNNLDCNDANAAINPAATESCDGVDNDCDGNIDDGVVFLNYYPDADGDGYGANVAPISACSPPANTVINNLDCNDANAAINPAATESCDGVDNDCDGNIDDGLVFLNYYPDSDGDGYGANNVAPVSACSPPTNMVTNNLDCNDANAAINPAATESCDGVDNDCDGNIDDGVVFLNYYPDADGDGYGASVAPISACSPPANTVTNNLDCNDANAAINPAATEICNDGLDNNCNSVIDEDNQAPMVTCMNYTVALVGGVATITPANVYASGNDNCSPVNLVSVVPSSFTTANIGNNTVTLTVSDAAGNTNTCQATVMVTNSVGTITLSCPANQTIVLPVGATSTVVNWSLPTVSSTCGGGSGNSNCGTTIPGFTLLGSMANHEYYLSTAVEYWQVGNTLCAGFGADLATISNAAENAFIKNNISEIAFIGLNDALVEGQLAWDNGEPVNYLNFNGSGSNSANNDYAQFQPWDGKWDMISALVKKKILMELNCGDSGLELEKIAGPDNGSSLTAGTYNITYEAIDDCGDVEVCSFTITVQNNPQTISLTCPANQTVTAASGATGATVNWSAATGTSSCSLGGFVIHPPSTASGSFFPVGSHTITYTATDNCSTSTCSFVITVLPFTPPTAYCTSGGLEPWQQWIGNVSFNTINHNSLKEGYGNFTNISTTVNQGSAYSFSLVPTFSWTIWNEYVRVWIDYNQDLDFNDPGELVLEQISLAGTPPYPPTPVALINGTITIPASALTGSTRMRVSMKKDAYAGPCEAFVFGEVEDYTLIINGTAPPLIGEDAEVLFFQAEKSGREVQLQWVTNTGYKNEYYLLEHSADGIQFQILANITNTVDFAEARQFQHVDKKPFVGSNFYRLLQVYKDGSSRVTAIERVDFDLDVNVFDLYPNPAEQEIFASTGIYAGLAADLKIYNSLGQPINSLHFDALPTEPIRFDLNEIQAGVYYLSVKAANKKLITQKFVVIKR